MISSNDSKLMASISFCVLLSHVTNWVCIKGGNTAFRDQVEKNLIS